MHIFGDIEKQATDFIHSTSFCYLYGQVNVNCSDFK